MSIAAKIKKNPDDRSLQLPMARNLQKTLGTHNAARYLAKRGWSLEAALWVLARAEIRAEINHE